MDGLGPITDSKVTVTQIRVELLLIFRNSIFSMCSFANKGWIQIQLASWLRDVSACQVQLRPGTILEDLVTYSIHTEAELLSNWFPSQNWVCI